MGRQAKAAGYVARSAVKLEQILSRFSPALLGSAHWKGRPASVLDLGAAPGAWLQVLARQKRECVVVGVDEQRLNDEVIGELSRTYSGLRIDRVQEDTDGLYASGDGFALVQRRIEEQTLESVSRELARALKAAGGRGALYNTILSDMMPKTTGIADGIASVRVASLAAALATGTMPTLHSTDQIAEAEGAQHNAPLLRRGGALCVKVLEGGHAFGSRPLYEFLWQRFKYVSCPSRPA